MSAASARRFRGIMKASFNQLRVMMVDIPPVVPAVLASPVPSPCVSLCKMNRDSGLCEGCLRTLDEIIAWSKADDDFKRAVWAQLPQRDAMIAFD